MDSKVQQLGPAIAAEGLSVSYGLTKALRDFDFVAHPAQVTAVIGPNGSGKTTFLNALTGLVPYQSGRVRVYGEVVTGGSPQRMHRLGVSRTFQNLDLIASASVEENVALGAKCTTRATLLESALRAPRCRREQRERRESARTAMDVLGIAHRAHETVGEMSYGAQRRVEVARALATGNSIILLDEPTAGMGPEESDEFAAMLAQLRDELSLSLVVIEHDMSVVRAVADNVFVLELGELLTSGPPAQVLEEEAVRQVYLGTAQ